MSGIGIHPGVGRTLSGELVQGKMSLNSNFMQKGILIY